MHKNVKIRRVSILCSHFAKNLAYHRASWRNKALVHGSDFWCVANGNFLEIAVLEWCKLFGNKKDSYHWSKLVSDVPGFERGLFEKVGGRDRFDQYIAEVRTYRDKFIAHLDSANEGHIPQLAKAYDATVCYHRHVLNREGLPPGMKSGLVLDLEGFYLKCFNHAREETNGLISRDRF